MSGKPILTNCAGVPFDVYYHGGSHAIVIGKISQGKTFCTGQLQDIDKASRSIKIDNTQELFVTSKKSD